MSMNFFPMTLIEMIKDRNLIVDKISVQQEDKKAAWFLSKEGETAYKEAKTPGQKTLYFYDYLCSICKRNKFSLEKAEERKKLIKIANILANAIENSFLDFGKYPDILMPEKNPIIKCVKDKELRFRRNRGHFGRCFCA